MPLESAEFINQLQNSYPNASDNASQGDDHLRLIKYVLKNTFPNMNGAMVRTAAQLNAVPYDAASLATLLGGKPTMSKSGFVSPQGQAMQNPAPEIGLGWNALTGRIHALVGTTPLGGFLTDAELNNSGTLGGISGHQRFPGGFELQWFNITILHVTTGSSQENQFAIPRGFTSPLTGWVTWRIPPAVVSPPTFGLHFTEPGQVRIQSNYTIAGTWQMRLFCVGHRAA